MFRYLAVVIVGALFNKRANAQTPSPTRPEGTHSVINGTSTTNATTTPAPTWPTASFPTFPSEFNDIPKETLDCWESWANYKLRSKAPNPGVISSSWESAWYSTYPTPSYSTLTNKELYITSFTKIPIGLTTLCDGYPRASSATYEIYYSTAWVTTTRTYSSTYMHTSFPGITKSGYEVIKPACTIAPNDSPMCDRVVSAYSWWVTSKAEASKTSVPWTPPEGDLAIPTCWQLVKPTPDARPTCKLDYSSHDIFYWPTPTPTGTDFCNSSWVAPTLEPTIPGKPNTAVVSGFTLTSPTVYHFFRDFNLSTLAGTRTRADHGYIVTRNVFHPYTITPGPRTLTYAQLESDMISVSWRKRSKSQTSYTYNNDFRINDIHTIRAEKWYGNHSNFRAEPNSTIFQDEVEPYLAVPYKELAIENKVNGLEDCQWVLGVKTMRRGVYIHDSMSLSDFHPITDTGSLGPSSPISPGSIPSSVPAFTTASSGTSSSGVPA